MPPTIEPFYGQLGRRIALARTRRGMTQEQLGRALEPQLTRASIANVEQGKQRMLVHTLVQVARALEVRPDELLPAESELLQPIAEPDVRRMEEALREADVPAEAIKSLAAKFKKRGTP